MVSFFRTRLPPPRPFLLLDYNQTCFGVKSILLTQLCATAGNKEKKNKKEGTKTKERPTAILSTKIESL